MTDGHTHSRRVRWEYFTATVQGENETALLRALDALGGQGWELLGPPRHTWDGVYLCWFKRRVTTAPPKEGGSYEGTAD